MRKKILLADDSVTIQRVVELTFPEPDFEVICVSNGTQAIERLASFTPDIALLDVVMPEKNGYDVCAHIKKDTRLQWMPVLLISGTFDPYDEKRATEAGAAGRLTKPFESRGLVTRVEDLIAAQPNPSRPAVAAPVKPAPAMSPHAQSAVAVSAPANAAPGPTAGQTMRVSTAELFSKVPTGTATRVSPAPAPRQAAPAEATPAPVVIPADMLERAVREAVSSISDKVIREVAWEVIPDIAEAIITRRIRELEEEAGRSS